MGWVAYQFKRTNNETGADLGTINIIVPKVSVPITIPTDNMYSIEPLVSIPDFPVEATVFLVDDAALDAVKTFGFGNAISLAAYENERWTLNNGNYIHIRPLESSGRQRYMSYYRADDTHVASLLISQRMWNWANFSFGVCLIGETQECGSIDLALWGKYNSTTSAFEGTYLKSNHSVFPNVESAYRPLDFYLGAEPIYETDDPYGNGGETEPGGGTGTFDDTGDDVDIPALPTLSAVDTGFITLYAPSLAELHNLANYMWSDLFDVNTFKKLFADPMQAVLGLSLVPVNVPVIASRPVKVGNISTDVNLGVAGSQYIEVDCGTLDIKEFWGAYLDYDPYTKAEIYLPYIGTHPLAVDDIMGKPVHVVYHVDILSGACCAYVKCGGSVLYSFIGQCSSSIPITGDNWTNVINGALSIAGSIGSMVATGGASAPMTLGQIASTAVNNFKPSVEKSGAMGGTGGLMGVQTPYIILTRPRQALPRDQNVFTGYPSFITENLADLTGYTEVEHIHLENVPATEAELSEIETLLKSGVIL